MSALSLKVFFLEFCAEYFEVKLKNQVKLDWTENISYQFVCKWVRLQIVHCYSGN